MELLERDQMLRGLREAARAAATHGGSVVVLEGESGVGKTSVLRAVAGRQEPGVRVLWGACDALATPRPLGPLVEMARRGASATAGRLAAGAPIHDVFDAFLSDLGTPTVAVMEDLHWADEATLDLLRFVGRRMGGTRSLLLGSLRDDEVGADHRSAGSSATSRPAGWSVCGSSRCRSMAWRAWHRATRSIRGRAAPCDRRQPVLRDRGARLTRGCSSAERSRRGADPRSATPSRRA